MPAALPLQTTHWVIPTAVNVSALSESLTNPSTTCVTQPKGHGSNFVSMQISTARVCFYISLFLLLCKVWANGVCPLSPSGSHRLNDLSMLAWSTHCDEEGVWGQRIIKFSLHGCPPSSQRPAAWRSQPKHPRQLEWFGSPKGSGFARRERFSSPVRCCSEAFVATRVAESFIMFYLVPKFDKTSFYFSPRMTRLHVIVCLHWCLHYLLYRCHPKAEKYLKKHN